MDEKNRKVPCCPVCGSPVDFSMNPYRPFCSKRCKMVDLGAWFKEDYRINGEPMSDPLAVEGPLDKGPEEEV